MHDLCRSSPQASARRLLDIGNDPLGQPVEVFIRQRAFRRLDRHFDGNRFLALAERCAFKDIEDIDRADQLAVGRRCGADDRTRFDCLVDHECEVAAHGLEGRKLQNRLGLGRLLLRLGMAST